MHSVVCLSVTPTRKHDHITPVLNRLHWLPVRQRVMYKTAMLTYKSLNIGQPEHLSVLLSDYTPSRQLRSSDHQQYCCPSQQTTQCSPAVRSAQLHVVFGTVYQLPFEQHPLPTLFDDTSRLIFSPATPPSTNCYHPRLRFELLF